MADAAPFRIAHCSDLHFGAHQPSLTPLLQAELDRLKPDLIVLSGDFTQTATTPEFEAARDFIASLRQPWMAVPGNHDVPRYNLLQRFTDPYRQYRRYISPSLNAVHRGDGACIAGINTARRMVPHWNWAYGAVSHVQLDWLRRQYEVQPDAARICVMHHPVWAVQDARVHPVVYGARHALEAFKAMRVRLVLSGHVHHAAYQTVAWEDGSGEVVFLSAATALSHRLRGQKNGFNVIDVANGLIHVETRGFDGGSFVPLDHYTQTVRVPA